MGDTPMRRRTIKDDGPDPLDRYVGARVRARRVGIRLSQTRLGEAIGVTFQQVQKYENGTNRIGASNLYKIARTLGVDVAYFFEGIQEVPGAHMEEVNGGPPLQIKDDPMTSREAIELMHNFFRVKDPNVRRRLGQFVKTLAHSGSGEEEPE
jgi:transcriptional regulator with XRE-family HTH domain